MATEAASAEPRAVHDLENARTAILRSFFKLTNLPPENWRDLADVVDDHLHVAWAAGYVAGASQR